MPTTLIETVTGPTKLVQQATLRTSLYQRAGAANVPAGLIPLGDPNTVLGMNEDGDALEYKVLSGAGGITITHTAGGITITGSAGGTVTSVGLQMPGAHFQVFNSPVTTSGTLSVSWLAQNGSYFLRAPTGGGTPVFGVINPDDFTPDAGNAVNYPAMGYLLGASAADETIWEWFAPGGGGGGTVTSVAMTVPSILSVAGSPITGAGTLAVTLATQAANLVFAGPTAGGAATPTFRALVAADMPSGFGVPGSPDTSVQTNQGGVFTGDASLTWNNTDKLLTVGTTPASDSRLSVDNITGGSGVKVVGQALGVFQRGFFASLNPADNNLGAGFRSDITGSVVALGGAPAAIGTHSYMSGSFWEAVGVLIDAAPGTAMIDRGISPVLGYIGLRVNTSNISSSSGLDRHVLSAKFTGGPVIIEHTSTPDGVALEINSTTGALLLPRMTTAQRDVLPPQPGLHIFNETVSAEQYYDGFGWRTISIAVGTVTSVTASSPLASSGGATPNITIQVATGAQNGYLSSADWTTFNNKQAAITFSAASKLLGRGDSGAGAPEEITIGSGLTMTGTTLSATGGGMSVGGTVTSGTTGSVLFVGAGPVLAQDNANLFWDDTNNRLGIGTITPSTELHALLTNATTNNATDVVLTLGHNSSGTAAAGFGARVDLQAETSTTNDQTVGSIQWAWSTATHASRVGQVKVYAATSSGNFEVALFSVASISFPQLSSGLLTSASGVLTANTIAAGRIPFGTSGTAISTNNGLYWDNTNERLGVGSGINDSASYPLHVAHAIAGGGAHAEAITIQNATTSAGSNGQAVSLRFALKSSTTAGVDAGAILGYWIDATHASATSALMFRTSYNGASNADTLRLSHTSATAVTTALRAERTNANLALVPAGTGALVAAIPDGASTGGNARGTYAVDLQLVRSTAARVASGSKSVIGGGEENTASGISSTVAGGADVAATGAYSFGVGLSNTASGVGASVLGYEVVADKRGQFTQGAGKFATNGDAQSSVLVARITTTDATFTEILLDGTRLTLSDDTAWTYYVTIVGMQDNTTNSVHIEVLGGILRGAGVGTTVIKTPTVNVLHTDIVGATAQATADTTNGSLKLEVKGAAATNMHWVARIEIVEVTAP